MKKTLAGLLFLAALLPLSLNGWARHSNDEQPAKTSLKRLSDEAIKKKLIQESIDSYPGSCPCPYNSARNGSSCGGRSAYSRPGGYSPLCYPSDVSKSMIQAYRDSHP